MRILHISSAKTYGGGESHLVGLCRELSGRGHDVFVALRPTSQWQDKLAFLPPENFLYISIRNSFGMFSSKRIGRFVTDAGIEIVHAHLGRDYLAASVAVRSAGKAKLVLTRHASFPLKPFHRFALRNIEAAIAVSPSAKKELEKVFPAGSVHYIPNGIDLAPADDAPNASGLAFRDLHGIPRNAPLVASLSKLRLLKGQRDLVLAANEVLKRHPECRFVIAGQDTSVDQRFRRELKRLVRVFGHEANFLWLDWIEDTGPLLAAADIFVSPSHSESFGLVILEAMASGTATIATETDGARDLIDDVRALVPVKDPGALADKICWYLEHETERKERAASLQRSAKVKFGISAMADATESLYKAIAARE